MSVTNDQVAAMHVLLSGNIDEHRLLLSRLDKESDRAGYSALIAAGFFLAADRRFAQAHAKSDIVAFVADARASSTDAAASIDPLLAERMIRAVFEEESLGDVTDQAVVETQLLLLTALVGAEDFDEEALNSFMAEARKLADRWIE